MCLLASSFSARFVQWIKECITTPRFSIAMNVTLVDYFNGGKGLRQGDQLSPNLFVIAMESFNRMLKFKVLAFGLFKYDPQCKEQKITPFIFAELLIFPSTDLSSIRVIKEALEEFQ